MRFFFTLLCMIMIGLAVAALVVVEFLMRVLPLVVLAAVVVAAVKVSRRWRQPHARGAIVSRSMVNVPDAAAFAATGSRQSDSIAAPVGQGGHVAPWRVVVDGTVIGEDTRRG